MERISASAKSLAELNGIEWQQLTGSGRGGQIIEQDILNYLAGVMSGELAPPTTPVDEPPPGWTGEDTLKPFDPNLLREAGVETDMLDFLEKGTATQNHGSPSILQQKENSHQTSVQSEENPSLYKSEQSDQTPPATQEIAKEAAKPHSQKTSFWQRILAWFKK